MEVSIDQLQVTYGGTPAVDGVSLTIGDGDSLVLLGQSGCGKTTTMRSIAGLETPTAGRITIGDRAVFDAAQRVDVPVHRRRVGMVFQSYAVWPHRTVFENVAFPLRMQRVPRADRRRQVMETLEMLGLDALHDRGASKLSGGQMQRVALARSLVMRPDVLLLDEPLSNLDARLRDSLRDELRAIQRELKLTSVYVTHDQAEALALADRIAVMDAGSIVQAGEPMDVYEHPATAAVARFLGVDNIVPARAVRASGDLLGAELADGLTLRCGHGSADVTDPRVCVRAEDVVLADEPTGRTNDLTGRIASVSFLGAQVKYVVEVADAVRLQAVGGRSAGRLHRSGDEVHLGVAAEHALVLPEAAA